jgi:nicotinate-nucleotide adenylyltransferase
MNIGIYGGSFNPPHIGHLIVVESVRDQLHFDKVLFIPSASPPNKADMTLAPAVDRLRMTELAVQRNSNFEVNDVEIKRSGFSFTIDTLNALSALFPRANFSLIIGTDNFLEFHTWKSPNEIIAKAELVVMSRPGFSPHQTKGDFSRFAKFVNVPQIGISGTDIRRRLKLRRSIRYLVPESVEEYINHHHLYCE